MSDFQIELGDGRSIVVDAPDPQTAAKAGRMFLSREKGTADAGQSRDQGLSQAVGSGALMNMGDEATAAVRAAAPGLANWMMDPGLKRAPEIGGSPEPQTVSTAPTYQGRYDEELARERAKAAQFQKTNPVLATGGNIAGGAASAALALPLLPEALTAIGPSAISNMARVGLVGAGVGGLSGAGEGEGLEDRLKKAGIGAAAGGVLGAASRPAAAIVRSIAEATPVRQAITDPLQRLGAMLRGGTAGAEPAAEQGAAERIATTFQRDRLTPEIAQQRLNALGPEAIPSDIGESLLQQGVNMKTLGGETRQRAKDLFDPFMPAQGQEGRSARAGSRMIAAAEGDNPPPTHFALTNPEGEFATNLRNVGGRAYTTMDEAGFRQTPELRALYDNPKISKAIENVTSSLNEARQGTGRDPESVVRVMHMVKREIQNIGLDPVTGMPGSTANAWQNTANQFVRALKEANPELAAADRAYAQAASLPEHYQAGGSIFTRGQGEKATSGSAPALEDLLQGANPQQAEAARAGAINIVRERARGSGGALTMAQDIKTGINPGGVQDALRAVMPNEAQGLINRAGAERIYANTAQRYLGGPNTANDLVGALGIGDSASVRATPGGIVPRLTESLRTAANWVAAPNEAVRNQIGRMLLEANPQEQQRTLALIAQILQQRATGTPIAAGAAGAAGAQAGRAF